MRSTLFPLFVLLLYATPLPAQSFFPLVGDWRGESASFYDRQSGFSQGKRCLFSFKKEQDGVFYGQRIWHDATGRHVKQFSGVIDRRNSSLRFTEGENDLFFGSIISPNEIELHQLHTKETPKAARYILHRAE